jgi:hypothetical protein
MSVRRSFNFLNQMRVDAPHMRSIESAIRSDFDELFVSLIYGEDQSYVIRGFELEMAGSIGSSANSLQMIVADSSILHGNSTEAGTFFQVPSGTANESLSSVTNTKVEGAFTPSALNYIGIEYTRQVDDSTTSQVYLWNPTTKTEITKTLPLAETLDYKIVITSSVFASNILPIAIVETDSSNNVLKIQDRRPMLFRLGTAGSATPDPFYEYGWSNHSEGRSENFWESSNSTVSPFRGGDKQIFTFKENDEALKTEIKQMKGTSYWYTQVAAGSLTSLRYDLGNTFMSGRGSVTHDNGNAGQVNWDQDIFLTVISTRLRYKIESNAATTDIDLDDRQAAYIQLIRGVDVTPQLVFTNGSDTVTSVGAIAWTSSLEVGDYVKVAAEDDGSYYEIQSIDSASQVTLTENFGGTSTGATGTSAKYAYGVYRTDAAPSTDRHVKVADIDSVPFDGDIYWLVARTDSGGQARVYIRYLNGELEQGETIQISDQVPAALLAYMGSASDSDSDPNYSSTNYLVQGSDLTTGLSALDSNLGSVNTYVNQNKTVKLIKGGTWSWDLVANELTNSASAYIQVSTLAEDVNEISAQTISLASDGQCAYVTLKRTAGASVLTVNTADISAVPTDDHTFIIARRVNNDVIVGTNSFLLKAGEFLELDGALAEINRYHGQTKISPANPISTRVVISGADIAKLSGSQLSLQQRNLLMSFDGVEIDFETGEVFEDDGVTPFLAGANDFTPFAIGASEYFWYSVTLLPESTNADNTINGQILVLPATSSNAVLGTAPKAPFSSSGFSLGQVYVQESGGGIADIDYANIVELSVGGSGSGSGNGFVEVDYHDPTSTTLPVGATVTIDGQSGVDDDLVLFSNLSNPAENNKIYKLSGVGVAIAWEATLDFNLGTPTDADTVIVRSGDGFRQAVGIFDEANTAWVFNDTVRYYSGADYWEQSSLKTASLSASTTDNIFTVTAAGSESMIIDYSLVVGSDQETGTIRITQDGTDAQYHRVAAELDGANDIDIDLFVDISATDLRFRYTNNELSAGTLKYSVKRWSNSAGGPGGIPSYSGGGGGGGAAAGANNDIQYNSGGLLAGDSNLQWDGNNLSLGSLDIEKLTGPLTLNDNTAVATTIISYTAATYKYATIKYGIERNGENRIGTLDIVNNGTVVVLYDVTQDTGGAGIDDTEIVFTATLSGGNVLIQYTTSNTGNDAQLTYFTQKW